MRFLAGLIAMVLLCTISSTATAAQQASSRYAPRDSCSAAPEARRFLRVLATAVANRDEAMLLSVVDEDVLLDFGGGSGHRELIARMDLANYQLWRELEDILGLGCSLDQGDRMISLPWYWGQEHPGEPEVYGSALALGDNVLVRARADGDAPVIARLNWQFVNIVGGWDDENSLVQVKLDDGRYGYVRKEQLRYRVEYRVIAEPDESGAYKVTAFVAGD